MQHLQEHGFFEKSLQKSAVTLILSFSPLFLHFHLFPPSFPCSFDFLTYLRLNAVTLVTSGVGLGFPPCKVTQRRKKGGRGNLGLRIKRSCFTFLLRRFKIFRPSSKILFLRLFLSYFYVFL